MNFFVLFSFNDTTSKFTRSSLRCQNKAQKPSILLQSHEPFRYRRLYVFQQCHFSRHPHQPLCRSLLLAHTLRPALFLQLAFHLALHCRQSRRQSILFHFAEALQRQQTQTHPQDLDHGLLPTQLGQSQDPVPCPASFTGSVCRSSLASQLLRSFQTKSQKQARHRRHFHVILCESGYCFRHRTDYSYK